MLNVWSDPFRVLLCKTLGRRRKKQKRESSASRRQEEAVSLAEWGRKRSSCGRIGGWSSACCCNTSCLIYHFKDEIERRLTDLDKATEKAAQRGSWKRRPWNLKCSRWATRGRRSSPGDEGSELPENYQVQVHCLLVRSGSEFPAPLSRRKFSRQYKGER